MILVTGATGMVGSFLLYYLLEQNEEVLALCRNKKKIENTRKIFSYLNSNPDEFLSKIKWIEADICEYDALLEAFSGVKTVYHAAAFVSFHPKDKKDILRINIEGTANVVNACLQTKVEKLAYVSSIAALGTPENTMKVDENAKQEPDSGATIYSQSKMGAEMEVWRGIHEGLNAVIVNPSIIIGGGDWEKGSAAMFTKVWEGLRFYTRGETGFVDVRDVAKALIQLANSSILNERFILNSENISYKDFFDCIADNLGRKRPTIYANRFLSELAWRMEALKYILTRKAPLLSKETARSAHNKTKYDNTKICNAIDYNFIPLKDSIRFFAEMFQKKN